MIDDLTFLPSEIDMREQSVTRHRETARYQTVQKCYEYEYNLIQATGQNTDIFNPC